MRRRNEGKQKRANTPAPFYFVDFLLILFFPERKGRREDVLSFLSGKEKKEPKKRNLNGKGKRGRANAPASSLSVDFLLVLFFPERKGRREDVLSFLSGKEKKEPKKRNLNGKENRERACAPAPSLSVDFLLVLFFPERKGRNQKRPPARGGRRKRARRRSRAARLRANCGRRAATV